MSNLLAERLFDAADDNDWPGARRCLCFGAPPDSLNKGGETIAEIFIRQKNWEAVSAILADYPQTFTPDLPPEEYHRCILQFMTSHMDDSPEANAAFIAVAKRFPDMLFEKIPHGGTALLNLVANPNCGEAIFTVAEALPQVKTTPWVFCKAAMRNRYFLPRLIQAGFAQPTDAFFEEHKRCLAPEQIRVIKRRLAAVNAS